MDSTYPLVPIANFLACILVLASVSKHMFRSWNVGACSLAIWVASQGFIIAVNSIIWSNNVDNVAPVWCDITTHLGVGSNVAIPAASLVIVRRLSMMIPGHQHNLVLVRERGSGLLFDLFICLGTPVIAMTSIYIVQSNRFTIIEEFGCVDELENAGLSILIADSLGIIFPLLSLTLYSPILIRKYFKHRRELDEIIASNSYLLDRGSFFKILALGLFDILITLPAGIFDLVTNSLDGNLLTFWPGWRSTHADFSTIPTATSHEWKSAGFATISSIRFSQWNNPLVATVFFALFGLTRKNRLWYRNLFWKVLKPFGCRPRQDPVASDIVFGSTPAPPGSTGNVSGTRITTMTNQSSALETMDGRKSFDDATDIEEAQHHSFGTQTRVVSQSITGVAIEE